MTEAVFPRATYRIQFGGGFGFAEAAGLAPYLAALGVSHAYLAPVFAARPGSTHGYDVTDPTRINPELGGEEGFRAMAAAFRAEGLGIILDIVPNHMGVGTDNAYWQSVLAEGRDSPYAHWFDIDWDQPGLGGRLVLPILGGSYGAALLSGALAVKVVDGQAAVWAHDAHRLPLCAEDARAVEADPDEVARLNANPDALDALITRQHWRPAKFDYDRGVQNYRRFFTVSDLAGVRVQLPEVFEATHRLILDLVAEGLVDGLRIDHIDGLFDPADYCHRLRAAAARPIRIWVEKILAKGETLPARWEVDGTTGYEFANLVNGLIIVPEAEQALDAAYATFIGGVPDVPAMARAAKIEFLTGRMAGELDALLRRIAEIAIADRHARDIASQVIRAALVEVIAALDVYRSYADAEGLTAADRARLDAAIARARAAAPDLGPEAFDFLASVLLLARPEGLAALRRLQQLSGPVMAKGVEDTLLYRHARLIALNEVGSEPGAYATSVADFHAASAERAASYPSCLLAASTHDTKRGEDARARISAITRDPAAWAEAAAEWQGLLADPGAPIDPNDAWFFFQLLLGAWPMAWRPDRAIEAEELADLRARVTAAMLKSAREAAVNTRWVHGDPDYEARLTAFIDRALADEPENRFLAAFRAFEAPIARAAAGDALLATVLRLTVPGVPDIYQGAEFWEQSLVDPDNRRPVDFAARAATLGATGQAPPEGAAAKLSLIAALLGHRAAHPDLYASGDYVPIETGDPRFLAYARRKNGTMVAVVARLPGAAADPDLAALGLFGSWRDLVVAALTGDPEAAPFSAAPVAVLVRP